MIHRVELVRVVLHGSLPDAAVMSSLAEVHQLAADFGTVVPASVLDTAGLSEWHRRRLVKEGVITLIGRGMYQLPQTDTSAPAWQRSREQHLSIGRSILTQVPGAFLTGASAAIAHNLPVLDVPDQVHFSRRPRVRTSRTYAVAHRPWTHAIGEVGGLLSISASAAVVEMASTDLRAALVPGDAVARRGLLDELRERAAEWGHRAGSARVRLLPESVDGAAESPLETMTRWAMRTHGIDVESQYVVRDPAGEFVARTDFRVRHSRVLLEVDGVSKYRSEHDLREEKLRQEALEELGWVVVRISARQLDDIPSLVARVRNVLARAAA